MPKKISGCIVFVFILGILLVSYSSYLNGLIVKSTKHPRLKLCKIFSHELDPSLIVFGSSIAHLGIDIPLLERITGIDSYNLGLDGTIYDQYEAVVEEFLSYTKRCRYMLFVAESWHFKKSPGLYAALFYKDLLKHPNLYRAFLQIDPGTTFGLRYIPGYEFALASGTWESSGISEEEFLKKAIGSGEFFRMPFIASFELDDKQGFFPKNEQWTSGNALGYPSNGVNYDRDVLVRFIEINKRLVKMNIRPIFIIPPLFSKNGREASSIQKQEMVKKIQSAGADVLDYSRDELTRHTENFFDVSHLNAKGAEKFSNILAADLVNLKVTRQ